MTSVFQTDDRDVVAQKKEPVAAIVGEGEDRPRGGR
jgi:hypothetical protein